MALFVIAIVAILLLLIAMRLRSNTTAMLSDVHPTRDRRSGRERRALKMRVPFDRRRQHRRLHDEATNYVNGLINVDSA